MLFFILCLWLLNVRLKFPEAAVEFVVGGVVCKVIFMLNPATVELMLCLVGTATTPKNISYYVISAFVFRFLPFHL